MTTKRNLQKTEKSRASRVSSREHQVIAKSVYRDSTGGVGTTREDRRRDTMSPARQDQAAASA
jgi:hypothetical protein